MRKKLANLIEVKKMIALLLTPIVLALLGVNLFAKYIPTLTDWVQHLFTQGL